MSVTHETLHSSDTKGKLLLWWMESKGDQHRSHSKKGIDGKVNTTGWTTCKGKNIGKKNETSPEEQALVEVRNKYKKKIKKHHHLNEEYFNIKNYFEPMLAHKYEVKPADLEKFWQEHSKGDVIFQPKLDGFRCVISAEGAFTREGEEYISIPHILESFKPMFDACPSLMLDGELYNHDLRDDFNELSSILRKQKPTEDDLARSKDVVQFHCYDIPSAGEEDYLERYASINLINETYPSEYMRVVPFHEVDSHKKVATLLQGFLVDGYEGGMIRIVACGYEAFARSKSLLKYKKFIDEEFEVIDIQAGQGSWSEYAKKVIVCLEDGQHCDAGIKGDFKFTKKLLADREKHIGKKVTIKFFARTPDNMLRFGVAVKWHAKV